MAGADPVNETVAQALNNPDGLGAMNRTLGTVIVGTAFLFIPAIICLWLYNSLVGKEEQVLASWAQVESTYQRRIDLVPPLVQAVTRYLAHERDTLVTVTQRRAEALESLAPATEKLQQAQQEAAQLMNQVGGQPPEVEADLAKLARAQQDFGVRMLRLVGLVEDYPELRSSDQFLELQAQIEGTENRINVARHRFNEAVAVYNRAMRVLPTNLIASAAGFRRKAYFEADEGAFARSELEFE